MQSDVRLSSCIHFGIVFFRGNFGSIWWIWIIVNVIIVTIIDGGDVSEDKEEGFSGEVVSLKNGCCSWIGPCVLEFLIGDWALVVEKPSDVFSVNQVDLVFEFRTQCFLVGRRADHTGDVLFVFGSELTTTTNFREAQAVA